ncbi:MAG: helix-hairpin-helix domain-containing protein, partial [Chitinophagales bacterium]
DTIQAQANQLQEDSAFYLNRLDAAEAEFNELKGKLAEQEAAQNELQSTHTAQMGVYALLQQQFGEKETSLNALQSQTSQLETDNASYIARLDAASKEYDELLGQYEVETEKHAALKAQAAQIQADADAYASRLEAAEKAANDLKGKLDTQETANSELQSTYTAQMGVYALLQQQFGEKETSLNALQSQASQLETDNASYIARLDATSKEYDELLDEHERAMEEHGVLKAQATQLQEDCAFYLNRLDAAEEEFNELKGKLSEQESTNGQLEETVAAKEQAYHALQLQFNEQINLYTSLEQELRGKQKEADDLKEALEDAEDNYDKLKAQATQLQEDCAECLDKLADATAVNDTPQNAYGTGEVSKEDAVLMQIKDKAANINFDKIGRADEADRDDLQRIKGIGPFIERKLNALGIFTFKQIASFDNSDIDDVTDAIEFFPGRIERDKWVPQAKGIFAELSKDDSLAQLSKQSRRIDFDRIGRESASDKDDLKRIKGIGPFIEKKLNALGIYTFRQISCFLKSDVETVTDVIKFFPGRIERDNWVTQAGEFAKDSNA